MASTILNAEVLMDAHQKSSQIAATSATSMKSAADEADYSAVFDTAELFEQILKSVDMKTLLLAQRVSKTWLELITSTSSLQKKLFFKPATIDEALEFSRTELHSRCICSNHVLAQLRHQQTTGCSSSSETIWTAMLNPLLIFQDVRGICLPRSFDIEVPKTEGSWKRMLYLQPSPSSLPVNLNFKVTSRRLISRSGHASLLYSMYDEVFKYRTQDSVSGSLKAVRDLRAGDVDCMNRGVASFRICDSYGMMAEDVIDERRSKKRLDHDLQAYGLK